MFDIFEPIIRQNCGKLIALAVVGFVSLTIVGFQAITALFKFAIGYF